MSDEKTVINNKDLEALRNYVINHAVKDSEQSVREMVYYLFNTLDERSFTYIPDSQIKAEVSITEKLLGRIDEDLNNRNAIVYTYELKYALSRYIIYVFTNNGYEPSRSIYDQRTKYQKIGLIKLLREQYNYGLKESKEFVDNIVENVMLTTALGVARVFTAKESYAANILFDKVKTLGFSCLIYDSWENKIIQRAQF